MREQFSEGLKTALKARDQRRTATLRAIRQSLFFAFVYNGLAIPLAAFGLLGARGPLIAAAAMGMSDLCVVGNALRLKAKLARERRRQRGG